MGTILVFALVLAVTGGLTAYVGDRLGTYIGKKRKSIAGLRPRHTAMLGTVVTGGMIAAGTLLLLLLLNAAVRQALRHGPQLVHDNFMLNRQNAALTRHALDLLAQAQVNESKANQAQAKSDAAQTKTDAAQAGVAEARKTLQGVQSKQAQAQAQAQAKLEQTQGQVRAAQNQARLFQNQARLAQNEVAQANDQVARAQRSVLRLSKTSDALMARNSQLADENKQQHSALLSKQAENVIYRKGEEVGRTTLVAHQPVPVIRRQLVAFLDSLARAAQAKGGRKGRSAVLSLAPIRGIPPAKRESAALQAISENIAGQSGGNPSVVLVARATFNTFKGEQTKLDLLPYDNFLVFHKGTVIAAGPIDGTQTQDVILPRLQAFLIERVRPVALQRGIIPTRDPVTGERSIGQPIDIPTWTALIKQIQQIGPNARIVASAADDTYSGDLLRLDLRAVPAPSPSLVGTEGTP